MLFSDIFIDSPDLGLRPIRALLFLTANVPNPMTVTGSPFFNDRVIAAKTALIAVSASFLVTVDFATSAISSALFICFVLLVYVLPADIVIPHKYQRKHDVSCEERIIILKYTQKNDLMNDIFGLSRMLIAEMKSWIINKKSLPPAAALMLLPNGDVEEIPVCLRNKESNDAQSIWIQQLCRERKAHAVIMATYARGKHCAAHDGEKSEMLVVSSMLPDGDGPTMLSNVIRKKGNKRVCFGEVCVSSGSMNTLLLPWANYDKSSRQFVNKDIYVGYPIGGTVH
jgi:hypothetical protein